MPRLKDELSGSELNDILGDAKDAWRSQMVGLVAPKARAGLPANEVVLVLGPTVGAGRFNAIRALSLKIANPLSDVDVNLVLGDPNDSWRSQMIDLLNGRRQATAAIPSPLGGAPSPSPTAGTTPTTIGGAAPSTAGASPLPVLPRAELLELANAYQFAQLSEAAYKTPQTVQTLGLVVDMTWDRVTVSPSSSTGFTAVAYMNRAKAICAIAFAGTDQAADWVSNIGNVVGLQISQYQQALDFAAAALSTVCVRKNIIFMGHSLGGGLAQYVYVKSGQRFPTYTFNPAGLSATNPGFQFINLDATHVLNFIATSRSLQTGKSIGMEPVSLSGVTLGREISVPVFGATGATHGIDVIREALGVYRDRCRVDPTCR